MTRNARSYGMWYVLTALLVFMGAIGFLLRRYYLSHELIAAIQQLTRNTRLLYWIPGQTQMPKSNRSNPGRRDDASWQLF